MTKSLLVNAPRASPVRCCRTLDVLVFVYFCVSSSPPPPPPPSQIKQLKLSNTTWKAGKPHAEIPMEIIIWTRNLNCHCWFLSLRFFFFANSFVIIIILSCKSSSNWKTIDYVSMFLLSKYILSLLRGVGFGIVGSLMWIYASHSKRKLQNEKHVNCTYLSAHTSALNSTILSMCKQFPSVVRCCFSTIYCMIVFRK